MKMVTSDHSADVFAAFDEVLEKVFRLPVYGVEFCVFQPFRF